MRVRIGTGFLSKSMFELNTTIHASQPDPCLECLLTASWECSHQHDPAFTYLPSTSVSMTPSTGAGIADVVATRQEISGLPSSQEHGGTSELTSTSTRDVTSTSRRLKNREKWSSIKNEVHQYYIIEGKTLQETMVNFERKYSFRASLRKWKMQMKEWNFDKNMSKHDMAILVAKAEKRARDADKDTIFYNRGKEISSEKFLHFKKRRITEQIEVASSSAATPIDITYDTPRYDLALNDIEGSNESNSSSGIENNEFDESTVAQPPEPLQKAVYDQNFGPDLYCLGHNQDIIPFSKLQVLALDILECARSGTTMDGRKSQPDGTIMQYFCGISYGLKYGHGNGDAFLPYISDLMRAQPTLDIHIWIAAHVHHNPFEELLELINETYGLTAKVSVDMAALISPSRNSCDIDSQWARSMHFLRTEELTPEVEKSVQQGLLCELEIAVLALTKPPLLLGQKVLAHGLLKFVSKYLSWNKQWTPPSPYEAWLAAPSWDHTLYVTEIFTLNETAKEGGMTRALASSMQCIRDCEKAISLFHTQESTMDIVISLVFCQTAAMCGEGCFAMVQQIFAKLLIMFEPRLDIPLLKFYTLLYRSVYYAICRRQQLYQEDMIAAQSVIDTLKSWTERERMRTALSEARRRADKIFRDAIWVL
ncbi:uncharacterized protein LY89DRAFT_34227 [Mollisia scopiformis]|uniref:Clr5 domain-containing protein n=1 Tax=Mollisia scopiformis TaxID=149040 RepID=A0A194XCS3_MOLSC|nr:uncharacterized protein LY89DRAFT_34227 [Mollisia scopiformis]KUJ17970.1 hypothetical protein LY89DRAFT_34227 [Mollisia scopiformis]